MRSSLRHRSLLFLCIALLSACGGDDPTDPGGSDLSAAAGTWTLQTVNGNALPANLVEDGTPFVLHSGTLVLSANGNCTNAFTTTPQGQAQKTETLNCTFTVNGSVFSLTESNLTYSGSLTGSSLTVINEGNTLVYKR